MKIYFLSICLFAISLWGCNDFLDVKPEDKILETHLFENELGFNMALNGIYINLASYNLYGKNLTMGVLDVMAQYYACNTSHFLYDYANYAYNEKAVKSTFESVWRETYENILELNNIIVNLEKTTVVEEEWRKILLGEAIGLRAFLHFDLLRLFGPVYAVDSIAPAIPYNNTIDLELKEILSANEAMEFILNDLTTAENYLTVDKVRTSGKQQGFNNADDVFYRNRNYRFNYFAAKALKARAYLYRGDKESALKEARAVIEEGEQWFPWADKNVVTHDFYPDRIFSSEIIFGIFNQNLYDVYDALFSTTLTFDRILQPNSTRLKMYFDNLLQKDYRAEPSRTWIADAFYKFAVVDDNSINFFNFQPMVRLSEMYLIAVECETDPAKALEYLNTYRFQRGLEALEDGTDISTNVSKEYIKEFWGEGQLFYYYKRMNRPFIPNGKLSYGNISMDASQYVIPIPESEVKHRN